MALAATVSACIAADPGLAAQFGGRKPPQFVHVSVAAPKSAAAGGTFTLTVSVTVDKPYHIQGNPAKQDYIPTVVTVGPVAGVKATQVVYPKPVVVQAGGDRLPVYEGTVAVKVRIAVAGSVKPGALAVPVQVSYQGCNDKVCYPPNKIKAQASVRVSAKKRAKTGSADTGYLILAQAGGAGNPPTEKGGSGIETSDVVSIPGFRGSKITQFLAPKPFLDWFHKGGSQAGQANRVTELLTRGGAGNLAIALCLIFALGLALNLTPCVYPIIPITIGYFGRQAAQGARTGALSLCYALGIASMYTTLGLLAATVGRAFGSQLSNPYVLVGFSLVMFALGLSNFDRRNGQPIWEIRLPTSLTSQAKSRAGYLGAFLMGLMVGMVAAPCIGPVVVALIQFIGSTGSVALGAVTFFCLGMGLATPYLVLGFGLIRALPRSGGWMVSARHIFGLLLFGMAIYYLQGLVGAFAYLVLFNGYAMCAGIYLLFLDRAAASSRSFRIFQQTVGVVVVGLGIFGIAFRGAPPKAPAGSSTDVAFVSPASFADFQSRLEKAHAERKDVLIDFSAAWCAECHELDRETFHNADVAKAIGQSTALRVDLTDFDSNGAEPYRTRFGIVGLPTVVHLVPTAR
jgi:thiol:disulfide interchange protein DsbD